MIKHFQIAICDDEANELAYIQSIAEKWALQNGHQADIKTFSSAEAFLFQYAENKAYDMLLLDIEMQEMSGIELARKIRAENETMQIIFITGFADYMQQGYDVAALHYLMKPVSSEKLAQVLSRAANQLAQRPKVCFIETPDEMLRIHMEELIYIEALAHSTELVLARKQGSERIRVPQSISSLEAKLSQDVVRCHRSYLVNLMHIERITKTEIHLDTNHKIPLSRRRYQEVNQRFITYYQKEQA